MPLPGEELDHLVRAGAIGIALGVVDDHAEPATRLVARRRRGLVNRSDTKPSAYTISAISVM
jgi:hypothetical protein